LSENLSVSNAGAIFGSQPECRYRSGGKEKAPKSRAKSAANRADIGIVTGACANQDASSPLSLCEFSQQVERSQDELVAHRQ